MQVEAVIGSMNLLRAYTLVLLYHLHKIRKISRNVQDTRDTFLKTTLECVFGNDSKSHMSTRRAKAICPTEGCLEILRTSTSMKQGSYVGQRHHIHRPQQRPVSRFSRSRVELCDPLLRLDKALVTR